MPKNICFSRKYPSHSRTILSVFFLFSASAPFSGLPGGICILRRRYAIIRFTKRGGFPPERRQFSMQKNGSRTGMFVRNTFFTAAYQIVAMIMGFVTPRVMIAVYGDSVNGLIGTVNDNILYYFKYIHVGIAAAAFAALYRPLSERDGKKVSGIVSAARVCYNRAGWFFMAATAAVSVIYTCCVRVTDIAGNPMNFLSVLLLILVMGVSATLEFFTFAKHRVLLMADQQTWVVSLAQMLSLLCQTAVLVLLPRLGMGVIPVRLLASLTVLVRTLVLRAYVNRHYPDIDPCAEPDHEALKGRWDALLSEMTTVFQASAGAILGTFIVRDAAAMSVYIVYHLVTTGLWGILKMVTEGVNSIFGNLRVSGSEAAFQKAYRDFESLYHSVCSVIFGVAAVLIVPFAALYTRGTTEMNYAVPMLGIAVIAEAVTCHAKMPFDLMVQSSGKFREVRWHCLIEMGVTVALGVLFGALLLPVSAMHAICGAIGGVVCGNLVRVGLQLAFVPKEITHLPAGESVKRILRTLVTVALIAVPGLLLLPAPETFGRWLIDAVLTALGAGAVTLAMALIFDREATLSLFARAKRLIHHVLGEKKQ